MFRPACGLADRLERKSFIVALGGGVVGDLAGFRGGDLSAWYPAFVQVPTTLLAQVDSSVGGKTGVNLKSGKNLAGAFYQPQLVLCDLDALKALPAREYVLRVSPRSSNMALFLTDILFAQLERNLPKLLRRNTRPR